MMRCDDDLFVVRWRDSRVFIGTGMMHAMLTMSVVDTKQSRFI